MNSGDKAFAILAVAFFIGLAGSMVTPWALLAAASGIAAIALAPPEKQP